MRPYRRIVATVHVAVHGRLCINRVVLDRPPVAAVSDVESIMYGWWYRAGGYPVGRTFGGRKFVTLRGVCGR